MNWIAPFRLLPLLRATPALACLVLATPVQAQTPDFPGPATVTATRQDALTTYRLPVGPATAAGVETRLVEGALEQTAWRIEVEGVATLALLRSLRTQLEADGWRSLFECETRACGGFDFRYGIEVLPEPEMHVDLGDFRFLAAERPAPAGPEYLSLLVSRSAKSGFVQLTRIGASLPDPAATTGADPDPQPQAPMPVPGDFGSRLETGGAVALDDLVFASGAADLAAGEFGSLADLAAYLAAHPASKVTLVGHTDASGSLSANVALSRKRADSVRRALIDRHGVDPAQVAAEGVGYLAPRATNQTEEGRTRNRRVEVILTSTP